MQRETAMCYNDSPITFKLAHSIPITLLLLIILIAALSVSVFVLRMTAAALFLELCCLIVIWASFAALLTLSPVVVTSSDITKRLFGIPVCNIRWEDVTSVYKDRRPQLYGGFASSRGYADSYTVRRRGWRFIDALLPNLINSIGFNDQFANLSSLLNIVNERSRAHRFPLLSTDFEVRAKNPSDNWSRVRVDDF